MSELSVKQMKKKLVEELELVEGEDYRVLPDREVAGKRYPWDINILRGGWEKLYHRFVEKQQHVHGS